MSFQALMGTTSRFHNNRRSNEMKHTQEPWRVDNMSGTVIFDKERKFDLEVCITTPREKFGGLENCQANALRIVSCVNACAGIGTDMLNDTGPIIDIITMQKTEPTNSPPKMPNCLRLLKKSLSIHGGSMLEIRHPWESAQVGMIFQNRYGMLFISLFAPPLLKSRQTNKGLRLKGIRYVGLTTTV